MSWAPTSRRGLALNCRLLVNGIQKASSRARRRNSRRRRSRSWRVPLVGKDGGTLPAIGGGDKPGGGLAQRFRWNWPEGRERRKDPMPSGERGAQGRAGEQVGGARARVGDRNRRKDPMPSGGDVAAAGRSTAETRDAEDGERAVAGALVGEVRGLAAGAVREQFGGRSPCPAVRRTFSPAKSASMRRQWAVAARRSATISAE